MDPNPLADAARLYRGLPHQQQAWSWLEQQLSPEQRAAFALRYRDPAPPTTPPADPAGEPRPLIGAEACAAIFGRPIGARALADLQACLRRFAIDTPPRLRHFLAQIAHESGGLRWLEELADGSDYEGRRDLGNTEPGDGRRFKGAGAIQLTGRSNYQRLATALGDPRVMEGCAYVAARYPFTSAGFWWQQNGLNALVDAGASCRQISQRVNGRDPAHGLAERERCYALACAAIPGADPASKAATGSPGQRQLAVPYFSQRDSRSDQGPRMCFSSSCAMLLAALRPGALPGPRGDDLYLARVQDFGDTTDPEAQVRALASYGLEARLVTQADFTLIERQIDRGIPVPCGFIHRGPVEAPTGAGHWLCVIGYTPKAVVVHDPYGDLDLIGGSYLNASGAALHYSRRNFGRRWMVKPVAGAWIHAAGQGWAIVAEAGP